MAYFMWRVLVGLHEDIKISFLPVGNTKFAPDWCFGLFKHHFRLCKIGCLDDIVHAVNQSATPNVAQLVGTQDAFTIVPMYDWSSFFDNYTIKTALKGITKMHHFHFSRDNPGGVKVKNKASDLERSINLLKGPRSPTQDDLPEQIIPKGLSLGGDGISMIRFGSFVLSKYGTRCALSQHHFKHYLSIHNVYSLFKHIRM